jgi:glutathione S-transferase
MKRGEVPTLVAGELVLYDSTVILEWLEERHPERPLLPHGATARARARLLEDEGRWRPLARTARNLWPPEQGK